MTRPGTSHAMERSTAIVLLDQYVHDAGLRKHCLATGAVMKALAARLGEDAGFWEMTGILHDIDFELIHGDMQTAWCKRCGNSYERWYRSRDGPGCAAAQPPSFSRNLYESC